MKHKPFKRRVSSSWAQLPLPALAEMFGYLSDTDRVSCAQVCRHWNDSFKSPMLWRRRMFEFGGPRSRPLGQKAVLYAEKLGRHLRYMTITCHHLTSHSCEAMMKCLGEFLHSLSTQGPPVLSSLEILGLELDFWRYGNLREQVADCLVSFLNTQKNIRTFRMPSAQFALPPGVDVLENVADRNGQCLHTLLVEFFFQSRLRVYECSRFQDAIKKCTNLHTVAINYCCLSDKLVRAWAETLQGKLTELRIRCNDNEPCDHVVSNAAWTLLTSSCPQLNVELHLFGLGPSGEVIPILASPIPLTSFTLFTGYERGVELGLSAVLNHVTACYHQTLRVLDLDIDNYLDDVDDAVKRIVTRCRKLTTVRVKAQASLEVARYVCRLLEEGRTVLSRVELMLCDVSPVEMEQLRDLREDMNQVVEQQGLELLLRNDLYDS